MSKTNYEKLEKSLDRLKEQYANYQTNKEKLVSLTKESIKESVIKRFEICHDTWWKYLKKYLQEKENLVKLPNSPNRIFRTACDANLIDEGLFKHLMHYNSLRGMAAHDYDEIKAEQTFDRIENFITDADKIYHSINNERI